MSDIVLTAAVRQNLLSLQGTADLLSTTQTRLATGKKVNSALDNPTNYFTAAGLDARAGDISNLLDSIGNGVQVLQAANTGITSLQKLVDTAKSIANQALQQPTGYSTKSSIAFTGTGTGVAPAGPATAADLTTSKLNGGVYTFTNSAGTAVTITVGTAASAFNPTTKTATVKTLDQLNTALAVAGVNLSASITGPDDLTFTSTNDGAGQTITGTAAATAPVTLDAINISANAFGGGAGGAVVAAIPDAVSQTARATLVSQYNQVIDQIKTTAQDASFNGINLLDGNSLKLIFNETGKSTLTIAGVSFDPNGLGLAKLAAGTDFIDNVLTGKVLTALNNASSTLRSQASAFGANLSIVQIRQDFAKNIINVLQTGSANLTLADSNEEAANSQALSTRQSIAVSALALANQSQQSVLKLLQ
ncbi:MULTISPECIES: flagellin N-terminal helical domain-containing protein [unclassified Bradyrhizobium]|uniref:flagellin N-terminal helical domain-containing protein n=1 Tax=unclassified Bradyrhizobium TaxID=2631580 RepID=UPI002FF0F28B